MTSKEKVIVGAGIILALVLGWIGLGGGTTVINQTSSPDSSIRGVTNYDALALGDTVVHLKELNLAAGEDEATWTNNTGATQFIDFQTITTSGTASSSFKISGFATSTATIPNSQDFSALSEGARGLIRSITIATSSAATTTNSYMAMLGGSGNGVVAVPQGWTFKLYLQEGDTACKTSGGGACEAATSTNRGFNVQSIIRMIATSSPNEGQN